MLFIELYKFNARHINIETKLKRQEFEDIIAVDIVDIKELIVKALKSANLSIDDIDIVATTGGSSLVPSVHNLLVNLFGAGKIQKSDAFTGVASGLAIISNKI